MTNTGEIEELKKELAEQKAKVEALERANKPKEPFKPQPYEPIDWTARMSMPPSALRAMVEAVPDRVMRDIVHDNRAPTGPTGAIPTSQQSSAGSSPANVPGSGKGWVEPTPLGPPPGINWVDAQLIADDVKQRKAKP
jgi:hypothetical protein